MKYEIYYKKIVIGVLEINDVGQHKYTPDCDGVEKAKKEVSIHHALTEKKDWGEPIPYFENRINNAKRFSQEDVIGYHSDQIRMIKVKE